MSRDHERDGQVAEPSVIGRPGDAEIIARLSAAVAALNRALREGAEAGLHCDLKATSIEQIGVRAFIHTYSVGVERREVLA